MKSRILILFVGVVILATSSFAKGPEQPSFSLQAVDGKIYSSQLLRGKAVFLTFFSEKCKPCKEEAPFLNQMQSGYADILAVLAVGFMEEDPVKLKALGARWGVGYTICVDRGGVAASVFDVKELPRGFLLNEDGMLIASYVGMNDKNRKDFTAKLDEIRRRQDERKRYGSAFWVEPKFVVQEGDSSLGAKWASNVQEMIKSMGRRLETSRDKAQYIVSGNVLALEDTIAVEVIIKDAAGREITRFSAAVNQGDDSTLRTVMKYRLDSLK